MRSIFAITALALVCGLAIRAEEKAKPPKQAPKVVLQSPDGKKSYDLAKLSADGPVLVRLTCACSGCDKELPYFQALQTAYEEKGLKTLAAFQEAPETASDYTTKKGVRFYWVADPKGELWKTFDTKTMPTNILIAKGGKVVKVVAGCKEDGKNAEVLSKEVAKLLETEPVKIAPLAKKDQPKK